MLITVLKSKIAYATVSSKNLFYVGSITIATDIMEQAQLLQNEQVHIVNLNNGERLVTYVIAGERGSNMIALNGAAARRAEIGDELFILAYAQIDPAVEQWRPHIIDLKHPEVEP